MTTLQPFPYAYKNVLIVIIISVIWQESPHYTISEAQPILTPFAILQTEDRDTAQENREAHYYITGESQKILYLIVRPLDGVVGGATMEYFAIFSQTGQLYLNQMVV